MNVIIKSVQQKDQSQSCVSYLYCVFVLDYVYMLLLYVY